MDQSSYFGHAKRILLVDDFEPWRKWVRSKLSDTRFQIVAEAVDGSDALQKAKQLNPDVILLDVSLPVLNGIDIAQRIRQLRLSCKIIFVTENRDAALMRAVRDIATSYLLKSRASTELIPALEAALPVVMR